MTDRCIKKLAQRFRQAIDAAHRDHEFVDDFRFKNFPSGCCGDTSYLLAEYLLQNGIETIWVSLQRDDWSHSWLVLKDRRVRKPTKITLPDDYIDLISIYRNQDFEAGTQTIHYKEHDLYDGLIIDITSDQFDDYDISVYVGYMDVFHQSFDFLQAIDFDGIYCKRLENLYGIIEAYIH